MACRRNCCTNMRWDSAGKGNCKLLLDSQRKFLAAHSPGM
jgi:hypothetical protein